MKIDKDLESKALLFAAALKNLTQADGVDFGPSETFPSISFLAHKVIDGVEQVFSCRISNSALKEQKVDPNKYVTSVLKSFSNFRARG